VASSSTVSRDALATHHRSPDQEEKKEEEKKERKEEAKVKDKAEKEELEIDSREGRA